MESIWNTVITMLVTSIIIYGGYFLRDHLQGKRETKKQELEREREIRDARRSYRENTSKPIYDVLNKLRVGISSRRIIDLMHKAKDEGMFSKQDMTEKIKWLEEYKKEEEAKNLREIYTQYLPLTNAITYEEVRKAIQTTFLYAMVATDKRDIQQNHKEIEDKFNSAYRMLEDYVTLAD